MEEQSRQSRSVGTPGEPALVTTPAEEQGVSPDAQAPSLAGVLAALEQRTTEVSSLRSALAQRDAELAGLRGQLAAAAARYRGALLASAPDVPPELVSGATLDELDASAAKARQLVERIRGQAQLQPAGPRIPAGAPVRSAPDFSVLSPQEKIAHALAQRR